MSRRRGAYVTKSGRVSRYALVATYWVPSDKDIRYENIVDLRPLDIALYPPSRKYKRQTLRCSCGSGEYICWPIGETLPSPCWHLAALITGRLTTRQNSQLVRAPDGPDSIYLADLTPIGQQLFGHLVSQRLLQESSQ
jgi:hypothetical protein